MSMTSKRDYYETLGVSREAAAGDIKKAYRKKALENHPDRNPGDEAAIERFKEASEAFDILGDDEKRARYDRYGHAGVSGPEGGAGFNDISDIFDAFGDLFGGSFFGGGGRGRSRGRRRARQGESLRTSLNIDLLEAASGCKKEVIIERRELCSICDGSGSKPGSSPVDCEYCGGQGQVIQSQGFFRIQTTCPACHGEGKLIREKCSPCNGTGRENKEFHLEVHVPGGVDSGMKLCVRGEGEPGAGGGPRGDLYVEIYVKPHPLFEREGQNLTCKIPIAYSQAVLGTELEVPILTGRHQLTIPAGTQTGNIFRLKRYGMPNPHGGSPGDLFVQIHVDVPKKLSQRQEELIRELAEIEHVEVTQHSKSFFEKLKNYFAPEQDTDA